MLKENDEARREVNLDTWHNAGYTGKGVNVLVLDLNGKIYDWMKEYAILIDPEKKTVNDGKHNTYVTQVSHEASPEATIYVAPWTHSSKEIIQWLRDNPNLIDIAGASLTTPPTDDFDIFEELGIPFTASSGNDYDRSRQGVSYPADMDYSIAVGAYNWRDKGVNSNDVIDYSNGGEDLFCVGLSNIYVQNEDRTNTFAYTGTSTSRPFLTSMLACYIQWRKEHGMVKLTQAMAKRFIQENCIDIKDKGFDYDSGYGLFCLPEIPILTTIPVITEPVIPEPIKEKEIIAMPRIYISPSTQGDNRGVTPFGTEEAEMNKIADVLIPLIIKDGRFVIKRNNPSMDVAQIAVDSNNFKADAHVAIHSNAGGGQGTEVYGYAPNTNSDRLAKALYNQIAPLSPGIDRGVKYNPGLMEVGDRVSATAALIELGFHDDLKDATWIAYNPEMISKALYMGICDYFGYDYRALTVAPPGVNPVPIVVDKDIYLSVRVLQSKADQAIIDINKLGFACKVLTLA